MSIHSNHGRAIKAGLGIALFAVFAFASGCAAERSAPESTNGEEDAVLANVTDVLACTEDNGRIHGTLYVQDDGTCFRTPQEDPRVSHAYCLGGVCPSCYKLSHIVNCMIQGG